MKKLNINLNPKKPTPLDQNFARIIDYLPLLTVAVVFFALIVAAIELFSLAKINQQNNLKEIWQEWEPRHQQVSSIERKNLALEKQKKGLEKIMHSDKTGVLVLEGVFSALPDNLWLESLSLKEESVEINGYLVSWEKDTLASLEKFINGLQEKEAFREEFTKINIKDTKKVDFRGRETTRFFLECKK